MSLTRKVDWTDFIATVHLQYVSHSDGSTCQIAFSSNKLDEPHHSTYGYPTLHRFGYISPSQSCRPTHHQKRVDPISSALSSPRRLVSVSSLRLTVAPMTHILGALRGVQAEVGVWHRGSRSRLWSLWERGVIAKEHDERTFQARTSGQPLTEGA
jgi:hypothetical protein